MTGGSRWLDDQSVARGDAYQARFDALAASGADVHGEANFVLGLDPPPHRVLDAGCGTGRVAIELARRGCEVVGIDIDPDMIATARSRNPGMRWIVSDLTALEIEERFDVAVLAGNVLLFVAPGTERTVIERCAAHLRREGALVAGFSLGRGYGLAQLDADATAAGLRLDDRFSTWDREPFDPERGDYAVSVFRR